MARLSSAFLLLAVVPCFWGACAPGLTASEDAAGAGPEDGAGGRVASSGGKSGSEGGSGGKSDGSGGKSDGSGGKGGTSGTGAESGTGGRDTGTGGDAPTCEEQCPENASCVLKGTSANCECDEGFEADGDACVDIDECEEEDRCDESATCDNTEGSYECTCEADLHGDGYRCLPRTRLVSVSLTGQPGNDSSASPSLSDDGRFVAFVSHATDLVSNDENREWDVFVFDAEAEKVSRVSVNSAGAEANDLSHAPSISGDGRYVVFSSEANNLVPSDVNGFGDIFRHDRMTGQTIRINVASNGAASNSPMTGAPYPSLSFDGNLASFSSLATNLVSGDTNDARDIFVRNVSAGTTLRVNLKENGGQTSSGTTSGHCSVISGSGRYVVFSSDASELGGTDGIVDIYRRDLEENVTDLVTYALPQSRLRDDAANPSVSADGRFVVFESAASSLVPEDKNEMSDVFLRDMETGTIELVSVSSAGDSANGHSHLSCLRSVSADGRFVVFSSEATNLVDGDTNGKTDVFVRDRMRQTTTRVSVGANGEQWDLNSIEATISADGKVIAFRTGALNDSPGSSQVWLRYLD